MTVSCTKCYGKGYTTATCWKCKGSGVVATAQATVKPSATPRPAATAKATSAPTQQKQVCETCDSKGTMKSRCTNCDGRGVAFIECPTCTRWEACGSCYSGWIVENCSHCSAKGYVTEICWKCKGLVGDGAVEPSALPNSTATETPIPDKVEIKELSIATVGSYITFGNYEQDNDIGNGKETIEWLVLAKQDNRLLVISRYALDCKPYSTSGSGVTWENSTLRTWLNKDFLNEAFSSVEQTQISTVTVSTDKMNTLFTTNPGKDTQDKIFLLSGSEVRRYFSSNMPGGCEVTAYAKERGAFTRNSNRGWWWLRSPGSDKQSNAMYVDSAGNVKAAGVNVNNSKYVVRPAMWIDLSATEAVSVDDAILVR